MKNIAIGKLGRSMKFCGAYSPTGGDNEPSCTIRALANHNPDKTFYLIGRSDFHRLNEKEKDKLFPYHNVVDVWDNIKIERDDNYYRWIITYFETNNIDIDFTVLMIGPTATVTIPNKIVKVGEPDKISSVIDMTKGYTTPIVTWLNECKPKYVEILTDPRCTISKARDMFHLPFASLGQYDHTYKTNPIRSYEDQTREIHNIRSRYSGVETAFCADYEYPQTVNTDRKTNFMIVLNEGTPSRYEILKEWILNKIDDVEIYGKWSEITDGDDRFKGPMHISILQQKLQDVKFTFIIPIKKGWVTSKYIEIIHAGVIPFLHPTYDEQRHLDIPEFYRPKTPSELFKRIQLLSENQKMYEQALNDLRTRILKPEYYDGTFLNNTIMKSLDPNYVAPDLSQYEIKESVIGLEEFFA